MGQFGPHLYRLGLTSKYMKSEKYKKVELMNPVNKEDEVMNMMKSAIGKQLLVF